MPRPSPVKPQASDQDRDIAAEYVLGTLDGAERETVRQRLRADPTFAGLVRNWERRLAPLHELSVPIAPPPALLRAILADLPPPVRPQRGPEPKPAPPAAPPPPAPRAPFRPPAPPRPAPIRQAGPRPHAATVMSAAGGQAVAALPTPEPVSLDRAEALRAMSEAIEAEWASLLAGIDQLEADIRTVPPAPQSEAAPAAGAPVLPAAPAVSADAALEEAQSGGAEKQSAAAQEAPLRTARSGLLGRIVARWGRPASAAPSPVALLAVPVAAPVADAPGDPPVPDGSIPVPRTAEDLPPAASGAAPSERAVAQTEADGAGSRNGCDAASGPAIAGVGLTLSDLIPAESVPTAPALPEPAPPEPTPPEPTPQASAPADPADPARPAPAGSGASASDPMEAEAAPHPSAAAASDADAATGGTVPAALAAPEPAPAPVDVARRPSQEAGPWRAATAVLAILAVGLAGLLAYRHWIWPRDGNYVAVLQPQASPAVAVRVDPQTGVLFVRAFTPPPPAGMAYHVWLRPAEGRALRLGAFSSGLVVRAPGLGAVDRGALRTATVAVTLEPAGGPAPREPRGEILFEGRLVPE